MRNNVLIVLIFLMTQSAVFAQTEKKDEKSPTSMGLWEFSALFGDLKSVEHHGQNGPWVSANDKTLKEKYFFLHAQESVLSNYAWASERDKKIKFGIQETVDMGWKQGTSVYSVPGASETTPTKVFYFNYEAALGFIYKIDSRMDVGYNYIFFLIPTFQTENARYSKFRFRYTNLLCELSTFGKTQIELKYVKKIDRENILFDPYIGAGYRTFSRSFGDGNTKASYYEVSFGVIFL